MTLQIVLRDEDGEGIDTVEISYSGYSEFRIALIKIVDGPAKADEYRRYIDGMKALLLNRLETFPALPLRLSARPTLSSDLNLFVQHSDCDGEFTQDECKRLYELFRKHKRAFISSHGDFKRFYNGLSRICLKMTKNDGYKLIYS